VRGIALGIDAGTIALDVGCVARNLAAAAFASRRGPRCRLANLAASSAVQDITLRIHAGRTACDAIAPAREGAVTIQTNWAGVRWGRTRSVTGPAALGIAIELHAIVTAHGFAFAAATASGGVVDAVVNADSSGVAVIAGHAAALLVAAQPFKAHGHVAIAADRRESEDEKPLNARKSGHN
jgi:hypothetical protein